MKLARLLECDSKKLLQGCGVHVPKYHVADTPDDVRRMAASIGKSVVLKALVPFGMRARAGAVRFAKDPEEAHILAKELFQLRVQGYPVERVLVEERLEVSKELYASVVYDSGSKRPLILASLFGGVEVEELVACNPGSIIKYNIDPLSSFEPHDARDIWIELGLKGGALLGATEALHRLYGAFERYDCRVAEINPLAVTDDGQVIAASAVLDVDDDALFRHPELSGATNPGSRIWRPITTLERQVMEADGADPYRGIVRYIELDGGDIGFMCGGGGGSLMLFDTLKRFGGRPANYSEFSGNPQEHKLYALTRAILLKPGVRGLFVCMNITNNTQVDVVAKGVVRAIKELRMDAGSFPIVMRLAGINGGEARRVGEGEGIEFHGEDLTMEEACRLMVERMKSRYPDY